MLRFGIQSLDVLFGINPQGYNVKEIEPTSICFIGPDGTGKSVLAMHIAAHYASDIKKGCSVFYISTDLRFQKAEKMFYNFNLDNPSGRKYPGKKETRKSENIKLIELVPNSNDDEKSVANFIASEKNNINIGFVNLASFPSGDDWMYINKIASISSRNGVKNLIIIDAIEGLEIFAGDIDYFGEKRTKQSRVTQFMKNLSDNNHVVLVIGEKEHEKKPVEVFVTDIVLRLRQIEVNYGHQSYLRRTVEIEKARGQSHIRGQHYFTIRTGEGTKVRGCANENPDDPRNVNKDNKISAYVNVIHSLHFLNRYFYRDDYTSENIIQKNKDILFNFGIENLDNLLVKKNDEFGLPQGEVVAIIGEKGTHKSRLARAFLSGCLKSNSNDVVLFITTDNENTQDLINKIVNHVNIDDENNEDDLKEKLSKSLVHRILEIHDIAASSMIKIIRDCVEYAKIKLKNNKGENIRLVIDNLSTMKLIYPEIESDPLFLKTLTDYLKSENLISILVVSEPGNYNYKNHSEFCKAIKLLTRYQIWTWHTSFFGENRIAATVIPSLSSRNAVARELKAFDGNNNTDKLDVDPHFEMYDGILEGMKPRLVPIKIFLWSDTRFVNAYIKQINDRFMEIFSPSNQDIVQLVEKGAYEDLRSFSYFQKNSKFEHTSVIQVDEFWSENSNELLDIKEQYINSLVDAKHKNSNDPYMLFQKTKLDKDENNNKKLKIDFFKKDKYFSLESLQDRVPYTWDFGFMMLRLSSWKKAKNLTFVSDYSKMSKDNNNDNAGYSSVQEILDGLISVNTNTDVNYEKIVSWREFLHACNIVARNEASIVAEYPYSFDVDMLAPETLSCLVLEVWVSEIRNNNPDRDPGFWFQEVRNSLENEKTSSLPQLLDKYIKEFFSTWLLLGEVFSSGQFSTDNYIFQSREASKTAVASRHWYSTAVPFANRETSDSVLPYRLPGNVSVRGDWFLAIAKGSLSPRLGYRAIDILSSRRANVVRLQEGIGLPTRQFVDDDTLKEVWTKLFKYSDEKGLENIKFGDLANIGAHKDSESKNNDEGFYWLWRSTIKNYDHQQRIFLKMVNHMITIWNDMFINGIRAGNKYRNGFEVYDMINSKNGNSWNTDDMKVYDDFKSECRKWIVAMEYSIIDEE